MPRRRVNCPECKALQVRLDGALKVIARLLECSRVEHPAETFNVRLVYTAAVAEAEEILRRRKPAPVTRR